MPAPWSRRTTQASHGGIMRYNAYHHARRAAAYKIQTNWRKRRSKTYMKTKRRLPPRLVGKSVPTYKTQNKVINPLIRAGILEKKQAKGIDFNEEFLSARCTDNIQYKAFNLSDVQVGNENASLLGIGDLAQGLLADNYTGKYIHVDSFHLRFNIQLFDENSPLPDLRLGVLSKSPRRVRMLVVAPKLANAPAATTPQTTDDTLFLDYLGKEYGLDTAGNKYPFEYMSAPVNKKNWVVIKDHTFKMNFENVMSAYNGSVPGTAVSWGAGQVGFPVMNSSLGGGVSHKLIDIKLPVHKKVCMDSTVFTPQDLLTQYRVIFISDMPSLSKISNQTVNGSPQGLNRLAVSARSFIQYVDA